MGSFSPDFFIGLVVATVFWLIVSQMVRLYHNYMRRIKAAHSPQSGKVPAEVTADANRARMSLILWFFAILVGLFVLWEFLTWGTGFSLTGQLTG